ncbi:MAG TPA: 3-phosphoglycerate dehydrogenase [Eubacterium sp.]|nr:3-phosphoglycerate dehydrogenase [Eubacterium sp.]
MFKYNCLNPIANVGLDIFTDAYEKTDDVNAADAILVRSASMHEMELSDNVKAVARAGAGVNNIPLEDCAKKGVVVFNTPGANANGVKELVVAGMLLASRDAIGGNAWVKENKADENINKSMEKAKKAFAGTEIEGKKLGIIGLGAIGAKLANAAVAMGMEVYGCDPYISVENAWALSRSVNHVSSNEDIFKTCDFISVHVPLLDDTKKMINKDTIAMMKDGVIILNFARDLLVDDDAMEEAIKSGKVRKYVTDFPNFKTANMDGVIAFPHLGASTEESEDNCAVMAVNEIRDFLENGNIKNSVNYPACDMGKCTAAGRVTIAHKNVPNMLSQFTNVFASVNANISDMIDKSRGEFAYAILDLDSPADADIVSKLEAIEGVIKVRVIK